MHHEQTVYQCEVLAGVSTMRVRVQVSTWASAPRQPHDRRSVERVRGAFGGGGGGGDLCGEVRSWLVRVGGRGGVPRVAGGGGRGGEGGGGSLQRRTIPTRLLRLNNECSKIAPPGTAVGRGGRVGPRGLRG